MSWKDSMRDASFKGVPFYVEGAEKEGGRRTVVHEFIQRENPYVEDMGSASKKFTVTAFVFGDDYLDRRDALERVLETAGSGTLVHPHYGEITVAQAATYRVRYTNRDGGLAVFTLTFVRVDGQSGPAPAVDSTLVAFDSARMAGSAACDAFDAVFTLKGQSAYVVEAGFAAVQAAVSGIEKALSMDASDMLGELGISTGYDLASFASPGRAIWDVVRQASASSGKNGVDLGTSLLASVPAEGSGIVLPENAGTMRKTAVANTVAVNVLTAELAVVEAAKAYTVAVPESLLQAQEMRYAFMDTLDAVLLDESAPAASYPAFTDLRAQTLFAMAENAKSAPEIVTVTEILSRPSLVVVYAATGGITMEPDFLLRNRVAHPGFVPAGDVEVLLDA